MPTFSPAAHRRPVRLSAILTGMVSTLALAIAAISGAQARFDRVRRLQTLGDAELARLGLRREDIVRHVYSETVFD